MDTMSKSNNGKVDYLIPFIGQDIFLVLCIINICCIKMKVDLPKPSGLHGLKTIFTNVDICFFLAVMFVLGIVSNNNIFDHNTKSFKFDSRKLFWICGNFPISIT